MKKKYNVIEERELKDIPKKPNRIVRCKNCVFVRLRTGSNNQYVCTWWNNSTGKNEFCSYGIKEL
ncbi:hypothetical protein [Clostridium sporogenes]|uniref:hypothetical protein n=1 Tax=Clostridium sporogenes TaxID=1509 RepID=UPI0013D1AFB6|nr:hypothetical protein [Clostridium sporogenes]NFH40794.1 hypothetical protein [Clostridium sporogenes]